MTVPAIKAEAFLANIALFRDLAPEDIARIAVHTRQLRVERGERLFDRGDAATGMHVIVYGRVKLAFSSPRGDEKVVEILGPGQSFGEAVMFLERGHVVGAQALEDSLLLFVARSAVFEELERDPGFARRIIGGMAMRLRHRVIDLEAISMRSGRQRVIGYLLNEAGDGVSGNPIEVTLRATKGVIASRLSLTQEHFSRILQELASNGLIEVQGRSVRLRDLEQLKRYTD
ncbi:MAG: Crp/Fnr family transcriptional regulator [Betaproteobacteria bacterium RIFCSPLOWO2_12_FULL_66_14]|nr:MAG: Crp/Fnr family transcriptional regulator [Betaproteobacteria bacterium RIFCSPLOWO2_12_FULL_66_14]